jgi:hypothetical protein
LKGNASPTEQEIENVRKKLWTSLSNWQFEHTIQEYVQGIYNKAISEAQNYYEITWKRPISIYVPDVTTWLNSMWITPSQYFSEKGRDWDKWWELSFLDTTPWVWSVNYISQL